MTGEWYAWPGELQHREIKARTGGWPSGMANGSTDAAARTPRLFWDLLAAVPALPDV